MRGHQGQQEPIIIQNRNEIGRQTGMRRTCDTPLHTRLLREQEVSERNTGRCPTNSRFDEPRQAFTRHATSQSTGNHSFSPATHRVVRHITLGERDLERSEVMMVGDGEEPASALEAKEDRQLRCEPSGDRN